MERMRVKSEGFSDRTIKLLLCASTATVSFGARPATGAAVVPDVPAYAPTNIGIDVADLPVGYSLGAGSFDLNAKYKAGYALEVGSDYSVSVVGTLLNEKGDPVGLTTGVAHPVDQPSKRVSIFTNASGKFGAEGLAPGRWNIEMSTDDTPTFYAIEIPTGTEGLFKAGILKPSGRI